MAVDVASAQPDQGIFAPPKLRDDLAAEEAKFTESETFQPDDYEFRSALGEGKFRS